jgi:hypothetical protein
MENSKIEITKKKLYDANRDSFKRKGNNNKEKPKIYNRKTVSQNNILYKRTKFIEHYINN